jgi:hypothetical protein
MSLTEVDWPAAVAAGILIAFLWLHFKAADWWPGDDP